MSQREENRRVAEVSASIILEENAQRVILRCCKSEWFLLEGCRSRLPLRDQGSLDVVQEKCADTFGTLQGCLSKTYVASCMLVLVGGRESRGGEMGGKTDSCIRGG